MIWKQWWEKGLGYAPLEWVVREDLMETCLAWVCSIKGCWVRGKASVKPKVWDVPQCPRSRKEARVPTKDDEMREGETQEPTWCHNTSNFVDTVTVLDYFSKWNWRRTWIFKFTYRHNLFSLYLRMNILSILYIKKGRFKRVHVLGTVRVGAELTGPTNSICLDVCWLGLLMHTHTHTHTPLPSVYTVFRFVFVLGSKSCLIGSHHSGDSGH